jgi:hypothetical protein
MVRYDYDRDDYSDRFRDDRRDQERMERMIDDARRELERDDRQEDPVIRVINDPSITLTPTQKKAINNPKVMMTPDRRLVKASSMPSRMQVAGRSPLYPTLAPAKRTRRKTKMDRTMSRCLKMANSKLRLKNGKLRKGKTMSDVMKMAHRLCKKS